jgi:hypothetical protein
MGRLRPGLSLEEDIAISSKGAAGGKKKVSLMDFGWLFIVAGALITLFAAAHVFSWHVSRW